MKLQELKVGRLYRVKQGRKLLNLRLKEIQTLEGVGTDLYELKITVTNRQLWMLDENIGKGYVIKDLSQIQDEIMPRPKENDLVKIVKGTLLKSLGSVTLYRVKEIGIDSDTKQPTVTIYGPFKNYVLWLEDVRVFEGPKVDPESLLSKESKKLGEKPNRFLPGPAVGRSKLTSFIKTNAAERGSFTGEEKKTKEDLEKEVLQEKLDKEKKDYAAQQHPQSAEAKGIAKKTAAELYEEANQILRNAKKGKGASSPATNEDEPDGIGRRGNQSKGPSSSTTAKPSSTANTVSRPSNNSAKSTTVHTNQSLGSRQPKARKKSLKEMVKGKASSESTEDESTDAEMESVPLMETDTDPDADTVNDSLDGSEEDVGSTEIPAHLRGVDVPMNGPAIREVYFNTHIPESRERVTELKNGKLRMKKERKR